MGKGIGNNIGVAKRFVQSWGCCGQGGGKAKSIELRWVMLPQDGVARMIIGVCIGVSRNEVVKRTLSW